MTFGSCGSANSHLTPRCIRKNNKKKTESSPGDQEVRLKFINACINSCLSWKKIGYIFFICAGQSDIRSSSNLKFRPKTHLGIIWSRMLMCPWQPYCNSHVFQIFNFVVLNENKFTNLEGNLYHLH